MGYKVSDYITLGIYKGIEVTSDVCTVTDAEVDEVINEYLSINAILLEKVKEFVVKNAKVVTSSAVTKFPRGTASLITKLFRNI